MSETPRLRISAAYETVLRGRRGAPKDSEAAKTRGYIQGKLNSAKWLIQTIEQRRRTMIRVMECIIREQREFFDKGIAFLRPLTLQQTARQIDMHESTVSRVCSGKYVQTPRGVFELKFFFSSSLGTQDGGEVSAKSAKDKIRRIIEGESNRVPLSDQKIADMLKKDGLNIARRTQLLQALDRSHHLHFYNSLALEGEFDLLETWLVQHQLPFRRTSKGSTLYQAERVEFRRGLTTPQCMTIDGSGQDLIARDELRAVYRYLKEGRPDDATVRLEQVMGVSLQPLPPFQIANTVPCEPGTMMHLTS